MEIFTTLFYFLQQALLISLRKCENPDLSLLTAACLINRSKKETVRDENKKSGPMVILPINNDRFHNCQMGCDVKKDHFTADSHSAIQ